MPLRRAIFDCFVCLSLFNLLLLRVWAQLLPAVMNRANLYYMEQAPHWVHYPVVLGVLFGVSGVACAAAAAARRSAWSWPARLARGALLLLFLAALNSLWGQLPEELREGVRAALGTIGVIALSVALVGLLLWLLRVQSGWLFGAIEVFAIVALPFLLMTVGQAVAAWSRYEPGSYGGADLEDRVGARRLPPRHAGGRVVWILFDELDQRAAFDARPAGLALPELDGLQQEGFFAHNAYAPARETRLSLASMLLGRQIGWAMPDGSATLPCALDGEPEAAAVRDCWSEYRNVFQAARSLGVNVGVAGWYHPYCRIVFEAVSDCTWAGLPYWNSPRVVDSLDQLWQEVLDPIPIVGARSGPGTRVRRAHLEAFARIRTAALRIAADPEIGLALLHFPIPHHPDIYDPDLGELSVTDERSYFDNLLLTDRTLGEVRAAMQAANLWQASTLIVTSDHWWRGIHRGDWGLTQAEEEVFADGANRRIPFLVKLPGESVRFGYRKAFNTLLLHDLVLEFVQERLATPEALGAWLDSNRTRAPIPYPVQRPLRPGPAAGRPAPERGR
jgi:hypothetical protein